MLDAAFPDDTASLVLVAGKAGYRAVSGRHIARWHRAGLLPTPRSEYLGRPRGTVSEYRADARPRLLAILPHRAGKRLRPIRDLLWELFGAGFQIEERYIRPIVLRWGTQLDGLVEGATKLAQAMNRADPPAATALNELNSLLSRARRGSLRHILPDGMAGYIVETLAGVPNAVKDSMSAMGPDAVDTPTRDERAHVMHAAVAALRAGSLQVVAADTPLSDLQAACVALANESRRLRGVIQMLRSSGSAVWDEDTLNAQEHRAAKMCEPGHVLWRLAQVRHIGAPILSDMLHQLSDFDGSGAT